MAVHVPVRPGGRKTKKEHYPPNEYNYLKYDSNYCLSKAKEIGRSTFTVINNLLNKEVIRNLRSAQNIIRMQKKYGKYRLEAVCRRAVFFSNYTYSGIKNILEREMDKFEVTRSNSLFFNSIRQYYIFMSVCNKPIYFCVKYYKINIIPIFFIFDHFYNIYIF